MTGTWLLLLHSIPPKPAYQRAKVGRRLTQMGALPLKRSAYVLPHGASTLEDFQWLAQEIRHGGGQAWILTGEMLAGLSDHDLRDAFRAMRDADYAALAADVRAELDRVRAAGDEDMADVEDGARRFRRRLGTIGRVDFFDAPGRVETEALMDALDAARRPQNTRRTGLDITQLRSRTWVTRVGVYVDRMASAWLIRRFIDPAATFAFVADAGDAVPPSALRFDMVGGEFSHEGNRCTFEVLVDVAGMSGDRALVPLAQIVHDLDLRDDRFQRPEAAGVSALLDGIAARHVDDHQRLAASGPVFDALYASFGGEPAPR